MEDKRALLQEVSEEQERIKAAIADAQKQLEALRSRLAADSRILDAKRNEHDL